jgi:uncharacterized protein involved in exopolysaccharide biosynthesis
MMAPVGDDPDARRRTRPGATRSPLILLVLLTLTASLLVGAAVAAYAASRPAVYASTSTLLIDQQPAVFETGDEGLLAKLSRLRFKYVGLIDTEVFAKPVADQLHLPVLLVENGLSATADLNTLLIVIKASMPTAQEADRVATVAADRLVRYLESEQFDAKVPANDQVSFSLVSPASGPVQTEPSTKKILLESVVAFLVVALLGATVTDVLRRRAMQRADARN